MRCPYCGDLEDRVIDSRLSEEGASIRRRRECAACGRRFTTFERSEAVGLRVAKRSGEVEPFSRAKVVSGMAKAFVNRPVSTQEVERLAEGVEDALRAGGRSQVGSQEVGLAILERLREVDEVAYVRFASVYHDFQGLTDFEREVGRLLKKTPPKAGVREAVTAEGGGE